MEVGGGGGGPSTTSCMMGFGNNSNGLSSMVMMMPLMSSSNAETSKVFLPLPFWNNNNSSNNPNQQSSQKVSALMPQGSCNHNNSGCYFMEGSNSNTTNNHDCTSCSMKAKIMAHPHYPRLLAAYVNCQKVGAPPEVVARLEEACASEEAMGRSATSCVGEDPALDQFMEAYCEMLTKYEQELTKPFKEAMLFLSRIECQFKALTVAPSDSGDPSLQPLFSSLPTP
ncbi:Homeobox protein SBH1 [Vitis vinifera]|uniref:Homeobox protein SBH1 n=1 Tax=Vitis vinifera TaxID=29760 RepID=A0A438CJ94_VITVI|nr:Homeobox protein SBH1 [Vitis vinifera]